MSSEVTETATADTKEPGKGCGAMVWAGICLLCALGGVSTGASAIYVPFALAFALVALPIRRWSAGRLSGVPTWVFTAGSVLLAVFGIVAIANQPPPPPLSDDELAARIDNLAIPTFPESKRDQYPRLFQTLGPRISDVEVVARRAAFVALRSGECDRVTLVGPSDTSTRENIGVFVDCENETRLTIDERQLRAGATGAVLTAEAREARSAQMRREDDLLIAQSQENVARKLRDPGSADFGPTVVSRRDGIAVCGTVNARNGFGGMTGAQRFINTQRSGIYLEEMRADFASLWGRYCE